jgi:hypothetical protein
MDSREVKAITEGFYMEQMAEGIKVHGWLITSHVTHKNHLHIQGSKHHKYLWDRHEWTDAVWNSIDWQGLKSGFLSLGPLKHIKTWGTQ